jgi:hypothetical protein
MNIFIWLLNPNYVGLQVVINPWGSKFTETKYKVRLLPHRKKPSLHNKAIHVKTYSPSLTYVMVPFRNPLRNSNFTHIGIRSTALLKKLFQRFSL